MPGNFRDHQAQFLLGNIAGGAFLADCSLPGSEVIGIEEAGWPAIIRRALLSAEQICQVSSDYVSFSLKRVHIKCVELTSWSRRR